MASYWNKPIISWVAASSDFNEKTIYTTLSRTLGPFSKMGKFLVEVFRYYKWNRVGVISSDYFIWRDAATAIRQVTFSLSLV